MTQPLSELPRVALIGISGYAEIHLDWLLTAHDAGILRIGAVAIVEADEGRPAVAELKRRGAQTYRTYQALLAEESGRLDLCFIPTGIHWHASMTIAALEAGANVLVEKPLAGSSADTRRVREAEKASGLWVAVGFQDVYTSEIAWLKGQLLGGAIGAVQSVRMIGAWPRPQQYYARNEWAGRLHVNGSPAMDSPLNNAFAHFVNLSLFLAGPSERASSQAEVYAADLLRAHDIESFDTAVVQAKSKEGVDFWFGVSHSCLETREPEIHIVGSKGRAEWRLENCCIVAPEGKPVERRPVPKYDTTRDCMFDAVIRRLRDPGVMICDSALASCHTDFIESVHRSGKIHTVSPARIELIPLPGRGGSVPAIRNIETSLNEAFRRGSNLSAFRARSCELAS